MNSTEIQMNKNDYKKYVMDKSLSKSKLFRDLIIAFIVGGLISIIGQIIFDISTYFGADKDLSRYYYFCYFNIFSSTSYFFKVIF